MSAKMNKYLGLVLKLKYGIDNKKNVIWKLLSFNLISLSPNFRSIKN